MSNKLYTVIIMGLVGCSLAACTAEDDSLKAPTNTTTATETTENTEDGVTFYQDVQPLLNQYCVRCHMGQGPGFGDFRSYDEVSVLAPAIVSAIESNRMPPPAADPDCHPYVGSDSMFMPDSAKQVISDWLESGKAEGQEVAWSADEQLDASLPNADLEVTISTQYTPSYIGEQADGNEYRCFVLEHGRDEPFYITELYPIIDQASIVHHIVLAKGPRDNLAADAFAPEGKDCISGAQELIQGNALGSGMISAWAPGAKPLRFDDAGILVQPTDVFVLQMHYYQGSQPAGLKDQSGYAMVTAPEVDKPLFMIPIGYHNFLIPAGDSAYTYGQDNETPVDLEIWAVFPHMHLLGTGYDYRIKRADGSEDCVVQSDNYDFNNQLTYQFDEPIAVRQEDKISWSCTWNNSTSNPYLYHDPPQNVDYGERTDQEMCYAFTLFSIGID